MIYETLIAPTERPNTALEVKRALLTFDKVYITDPGDRDFFPPQAMWAALGMPFLGVNMGPVRPLGKLPGYDSAFDELMSEIDIARRQGLIDVIASYDRTSTSDSLTIGAIPLGGYPLNVQFLLHAYRNVARSNDVLLAGVTGDSHLFGLPPDEIASAAIEGCKADVGINDDPPLPLLDGPLSLEALRPALSNIARARIASVIKTIGFCVTKEMIPFIGSTNYGLIAASIAHRASDVIDSVSTHDPSWAGRSRILQIAHEEYIDETVLDTMSIDDVIRLRTQAWGEQAEARDALLHSLAELSKELTDESNFDAVAQDRIRAYRATAEAVQRERAALKARIYCDAVNLAGGTIGGGGAIAGLLSQLQTALGAATTLLAGCLLYTSERIKEYGPVIEQLSSAENEFKDDAGFGLHDFFARIDTASKG